MFDHNMVDKNGLELDGTICDHRPITEIKWETIFWLIAVTSPLWKSTLKKEEEKKKEHLLQK